MTHPIRTSADRRAARTREALRAALMTLMVEHGWDGVEVQALCERANIGRSTFYLHYPNKEALLDAGFADLHQALLQHPATGLSAEQAAWAPVAGLIAHAQDEQEVFRSLIGRRSGLYVQHQFRQLLLALIDHCLTRHDASPPQATPGAQAHFLAGGLFELLVWWLGPRRPESAERVLALFTSWASGPAGACSSATTAKPGPTPALCPNPVSVL